MTRRHQFEFLPITSGEPHSSGIFDHWEYEVILVTSEWVTSQPPSIERLSTSHRFKDFEALRHLLSYENPGLIVPPLPGLEWVGVVTKVMSNLKPDPIVVSWRMKGLSMFLEHLAGWSAASRSEALRHFVLDDPLAWQAFVTQMKEAAKSTSMSSAFRLGREPSARRQLFSPALVDAESWVKRMEPEIETLKDRLNKLQQMCLSRLRRETQIATGAEASSYQDDVLGILEGIAGLVLRAEQTVVPQLEQWLVLLMADVSFFGGLANSVRDACSALFRLEGLRVQRLEAKKEVDDSDLIQDRLDRGLELFAVEYLRLKRWKRLLCTRICHIFGKLSLHLMSAEVDWRSGGEPDQWLKRLPE
eukprot:GGOE01055003.1.p1 GENE.GGOE01055003.1~~GGOE01055003.1.p1  ORF type:complete len:360 (-),score=56.60 GGOE01055003.1:174-1253(-)